MTNRKSPTPHQKHATRSSSNEAVTPDRFPLFAEFLRGYLHQDAVPEYGDPLRAAKAYLSDLATNDHSALSREVELIKTALAGRTINIVNSELNQLGSQWIFTSTDEFETMLAILAQQ